MIIYIIIWLLIANYTILQYNSLSLPYLKSRKFVSSLKLSTNIEIDRSLNVLQSKHPNNNIPESIIAKVGEDLHLKQNHPISIIKNKYIIHNKLK